jgi:hypothetical protein
MRKAMMEAAKNGEMPLSGMPPEGMFGQGNGEDDEDGRPGVGPQMKIGEDEEFLFEKYFKSGEYMDLGKKRRQWRDEKDEEDELGLD